MQNDHDMYQFIHQMMNVEPETLKKSAQTSAKRALNKTTDQMFQSSRCARVWEALPMGSMITKTPMVSIGKK